MDAGGFHKYAHDESVLRVELFGVKTANRLGLRRLKPKALKRTARHIVEDYLRLHDRPVMFSLMGAAALAVLEPFADNDQRVALWLKGLSGVGKSFSAKLTAGFFGDFDPRSGSHCANWIWTANTIEKVGYAHRGALYVVDDFKPEIVKKGVEAVRIMQAYADSQGRGRLFSDTRSAPVWPVRGLLLSTGEDVPQNSASALARTIVVEVPNRPKDAERAGRCRENRRRYRGVMAGFIAHMIRSDRFQKFADRAERCKNAYYEDIAGMPNDARIAANFGLLAAAAYEFAAYLGSLGVWPNWKAEVRAYRNEDLIAMRDAMLRLVGNEQAHEVFLNELRQLVAAEAVRLKGAPGHQSADGLTTYDRAPLVGRVDGARVEIIVEAAMAEVQRSLRAQGRPELAISKETLLEQLVSARKLLNQKGKRIKPDDKGRRVYQQRILKNGARSYVAALPSGVLGLDSE